jgi:hypothetical protein
MENLNVMTLRFHDMPDGTVKATAYAGTNNYLFQVDAANRSDALNQITTKVTALEYHSVLDDAINRRD